MILVAVGTFIHGFDELVEAADLAAEAQGVPGVAQLGHGRHLPRHLSWERFMAEPRLGARIRAARVVICHGGMGILGEAMRAGRPILAMPRRGATSASHPANDQRAFLNRLADRYPIRVCPEPRAMAPMLAAMLAEVPPGIRYPLGSDLPDRLRRFLAASQ